VIFLKANGNSDNFEDLTSLIGICRRGCFSANSALEN